MRAALIRAGADDLGTIHTRLVWPASDAHAGSCMRPTSSLCGFCANTSRTPGSRRSWDSCLHLATAAVCENPAAESSADAGSIQSAPVADSAPPSHVARRPVAQIRSNHHPHSAPEWLCHVDAV